MLLRPVCFDAASFKGAYRLAVGPVRYQLKSREKMDPLGFAGWAGSSVKAWMLTQF
jgi:hypothetical protein